MNTKERIRELANKKGMSLPRLEEVLGFGSGTIVKWGKASPSVDKLAKVADYFSVSIDYLVGREENRTLNVRFSIDELYALASDEDKAVIDLILAKYKKEARTGSEVS